MEVSGGQAETTKDGMARFDQLTFTGRQGSLSLYFASGDKESTPIRLTLEHGRPATLVILDQPSGTTVSDSIFRRRLKVKVLDGGQNPLEDQEVRVQLCDAKATQTACEAPDSAELMGTSFRNTSKEGEASFDSLGISGRMGKYYLRVTVTQCGSCTTLTTSITYDPNNSLNRNYVAISAIKSIAGLIPDDEFFDIRFRFRVSNNLFVLATTDVALTSRGSDTVRSNQRRLTEASLSLNRTLHMFDDDRTSVPERVLYAGPLIKVFNTFPYAGIHLGSMELAGSPFQGSSLVIGPVFGLYSAPRVVGDRVVRPQLFNLLTEFFVRSETIDFFKSLNIRGSILLPAARGEPLSSRIGIAVPVGTLHVF